MIWGVSIGVCIIFIGVCIIFGIVSYSIANSKGYENGFWWGFFLNIIGIIVVACRTDKRILDQFENNANSQNPDVNQNNIPQTSSKPTSGWICPDCGTHNDDSALQCNRCGCSSWTCLSCKTVNKVSASFCKKCGHSVVRYTLCQKCGAKNFAEADICSSCGAWLKSWHCPRCGVLNESDANFCEKCGTSRDADTSTLFPVPEKGKINIGTDFFPDGICDFCGAAECYVTNVTSFDDSGIKYRKACQECAKSLKRKNS